MRPRDFAGGGEALFIGRLPNQRAFRVCQSIRNLIGTGDGDGCPGDRSVVDAEQDANSYDSKIPMAPGKFLIGMARGCRPRRP